MKVMQIGHNSKDKADYSFDYLVSQFKGLLDTLPDLRNGLNKTYSIANAALSAFSVFFMQSPSFLAHQTKLQEARGFNNAHTLFQVDNIPSDNHIRNLLDPIAPNNITPMFDNVFNGLNSMNYFEHYRSINGTILIPMDGVNYFSSNNINCPNCNTQKNSDGTTCYLHKAITPVIAAPGNPRVISLAPEFITPQDGHNKQDGEIAAAKRWLKEHGHKYRPLGVTILGDDLFSHQPMCEAVQVEGFNFIFNCKPSTHATVYKDITKAEELNKVDTVVVSRIEGIRVIRQYIDTYRFVNNVRLRDSDDTLMVNWCELITTNEQGEQVFINSFITDHTITKNNVAEIVRAGRTRWKVENENNNTLKNHGYNLEHNFGHGQKYLSQFLLTLNLLAFLFHTVLSVMDKKYIELREKLPTRKIFFEHIKTLTIYLCFKNWDALLQFMLDGLNNRVPIEQLYKYAPSNTS